MWSEQGISSKSIYKHCPTDKTHIYHNTFLFDYMLLISTKWQIPNASQMEADLIDEKGKVSFLSTHQLINI